MDTFCGEIFSKEILYCSWLAGYIPGRGGSFFSKVNPLVFFKGNPLTGERGTFHWGGGEILRSKKKASNDLF